MARKHTAAPPDATPAPDGTPFQSALDLSVLMSQNLAQMQRAQLDAWMAWHKTAADLRQELWDEWTCRWGGGAPIDV